MALRRVGKGLMGDINVVPYIDVMLVLLVIFMITAPLLTQGVKVDLPQASANPIDQEAKEPLVVSVDKAGNLYLNLGENEKKPVTEEDLVRRASLVLKQQPDVPVLVRGDKDAAYGKVVYAMTLLQQAGAPSVGLSTQPPEKSSRRR
jgi:biopolymer transport protein TolR